MRHCFFIRNHYSERIFENFSLKCSRSYQNQTRFLIPTWFLTPLGVGYSIAIPMGTIPLGEFPLGNIIQAQVEERG